MGSGGRYWLGAVGSCLWVLSTAAWADGGFLAMRDMREPEQKAAVLFADGVEDLIIQVKYDGAVGDFAWLVPLPSKPEVALAEDAIFGELREYALERRKWLDDERVSGYRSGGFGAPDDTSASDGVNVLERKRVVVFDVAVLEANTADDLVRWCEGHGYKVKDAVREVLGSYVGRGWIFTAMRIDPATQGKENTAGQEAGTIQAMRFTFSTEEAVYPLHISSINRGTTDVLVYVVAEDMMIHPAFVQRHPAPFDALEQWRAQSGSEGQSKWRDRFSANFDHARFSYRSVAPAELERTRGAFPRWKNRALYLTALQQSFEPEEMVQDVVFKRPEGWGADDQMAFITSGLTFFEYFPDTLCLRMPEGIVASLKNELVTSDAKLRTSWLSSLVRLAIQLEKGGGADVLVAAVQHSNPEIRRVVLHELRRAGLFQTAVSPTFDTVVEGPNCEKAHAEYVTDEGRLQTCHYLITASPSSVEHLDVRVLEELFRRSDPDLEVAKMLAAMNTDQSMNLLFEAARGALDNDGGVARNSRQEMALMALRHNSSPELAGLYRSLYAKHRDALNEREVASCLVGLWTLNDPATDSLVRQFEGHCLESQMPSAAAIARNLLINRLRTREPIVHEDMHLANLEREMGGRGVIVNRLMAGDEEVIQYRWETGVATVKSDIVVKWKPSGA